MSLHWVILFTVLRQIRTITAYTILFQTECMFQLGSSKSCPGVIAKNCFLYWRKILSNQDLNSGPLENILTSTCSTFWAISLYIIAYQFSKLIFKFSDTSFNLKMLIKLIFWTEYLRSPKEWLGTTALEWQPTQLKTLWRSGWRHYLTP